LLQEERAAMSGPVKKAKAETPGGDVNTSARGLFVSRLPERVGSSQRPGFLYGSFCGFWGGAAFPTCLVADACGPVALSERVIG
jgi:hypothetical protein